MKLDKNLAILVLVFAALTEWFYLLFEGEIHSFYDRNGIKTVLYWSDMVYYFINESFTLIIVGIMLLKLSGKEAKTLITGVFIWFLIEWIEIVLQMAKIDNSRLYVNDGAWLQLSTCITISILVYFGSKKLTS